MRKDRPKLVDQYAVQFVIGAVIAINFVPWFFEPFGMLLSEPLEAARLLFGRALLAGIIIGIFVAVRRYGWVSTALFFLNPTLAFGWVRARGKLADKLTEVTSRPRPTRKPVERKVTEPKQVAPRTSLDEIRRCSSHVAASGTDACSTEVHAYRDRCFIAGAIQESTPCV